VRTSAVFFLDCRDRRHVAVTRFTTQPAKECSLQELGIQPVGLRSSVLARHGNTCRVDDVGLNVVRPKPPGQPETITASLEGDSNPLDPAARSDCLISPPLQKP
jgi:hypothetical protein